MDLERIERYLDGTATPEEARAVAEWLEGVDPSEFEAALAAEARKGAPVDVDSAWLRLAGRLEIEVAPGAPNHDAAAHATALPARRRLWRSRGLRAAVVAGLLVTGWAVARQAMDHGASVAETVADAGEPLRTVLADGSAVVLAPGSVLRVPADYGAAVRHVELHGEAYFEVVPDPNRPFVASTRRSTTRVLGTRFAVRDVEGARPRVVVREGRVAVSAPNDQQGGARLGAGQMAWLGPDGSATVATADLDAALAFTEGRLVIRDAPLHLALMEISRWYGVNARVDDPVLSDRLITAHLADAALDEALQAVALAADAEVQREGDTFVFTPR